LYTIYLVLLLTYSQLFHIKLVLLNLDSTFIQLQLYYKNIRGFSFLSIKIPLIISFRIIVFKHESSPLGFDLSIFIYPEIMIYFGSFGSFGRGVWLVQKICSPSLLLFFILWAEPKDATFMSHLEVGEEFFKKEV